MPRSRFSRVSPAGNQDQGMWGELIAAELANDLGFNAEDFDPKKNGFDAVFRDKDGALVLVESKLSDTQGPAALDHTKEGPEMSSSWIVAKAREMCREGSPYYSESNALIGQEILDTGVENVRKILITTDPATGIASAYECGSDGLWDKFATKDTRQEAEQLVDAEGADLPPEEIDKTLPQSVNPITRSTEWSSQPTDEQVEAEADEGLVEALGEVPATVTEPSEQKIEFSERPQVDASRAPSENAVGSDEEMATTSSKMSEPVMMPNGEDSEQIADAVNGKSPEQEASTSADEATTSNVQPEEQLPQSPTESVETTASESQSTDTTEPSQDQEYSYGYGY